MKTYYNKLSTDLVECCFCGRSINLFNINKHLTKSKTCQTFQKHTVNSETELFKFRKKVNQLKEEIKNNT